VGVAVALEGTLVGVLTALPTLVALRGVFGVNGLEGTLEVKALAKREGVAALVAPFTQDSSNSSTG